MVSLTRSDYAASVLGPGERGAVWGSRPPEIGRSSTSPSVDQAFVLVPNEVPFHKLMALLDGLDVRFVIGLDGRVTNSAPSPASTLPDVTVQNCIAHTFDGLQFPPPDDGVVNVVYPIVLKPD